ncbi:MAG: DUF2851 family protein [Dehalococcoidia bacterium]
MRATPVHLSPEEPRDAASLGALREADLAVLWERGHVPASAMVSLGGTPMHIIYRGRRNAGPGPDFRDAMLALPDGSLLHGDVELHLRASDFRRHGHGRDPAYNSVILHLVYHADDGASTVLQSGGRAPVVSLERWLLARAGELRQILEQPALWREPCQTSIERMGTATVGQTLERLGDRRLRAKSAALAGRLPAIALYQGLLRTLGHGSQQAAWLQLDDRVPPTVLQRLGRAAGTPPDASTLEAILLGSAGLLPALALREDGGESSPYLRHAWQVWQSCGLPAGAAIQTSGSRRPANHPARRLEGLARLLGGGLQPLLDGLHGHVRNIAEPAPSLVRLLTVPAAGIWQERYLPWDDSTAAAPPPALIGAGKALELAINAVLPVLLAMADRDRERELADTIYNVLHALPAPPPYGRTAHLDRALRAEGESLIRGAARSQGTLHLFAGYCTQGGCGHCPLS